MSFTLILAATAAVAASLGYLAARRHGKPELDGARDSDDHGEKKDTSKKEAAVEPAPFATLPFALGDVVSGAYEERWLAGAVVAREGGRVIGALFLAPEAATQKAVAAFPPPRRDIWWMAPAELSSPEEPPATIELSGVALERKARLPVSLERLGLGAPSVGSEGIWAVYERGWDVALVIASQGEAYAWVGRRLEEDEYDRLGEGEGEGEGEGNEK